MAGIYVYLMRQVVVALAGDSHLCLSLSHSISTITTIITLTLNTPPLITCHRPFHPVTNHPRQYPSLHPHNHSHSAISLSFTPLMLAPDLNLTLPLTSQKILHPASRHRPDANIAHAETRLQCTHSPPLDTRPLTLN